MAWLKLQRGVILNLGDGYWHLAQEWADGSMTLLMPQIGPGPPYSAEIPPGDRGNFLAAIEAEGLFGTYSAPPPERPSEDEIRARQKEMEAEARKQLFVPPGGLPPTGAMRQMDARRRR